MVELIAIGVSAGGLKALSALLPPLPRDFRPGIVVVQHLQEGTSSLLSSILGPLCAVPVKEAEMGEEIQGGTIYLAPPSYHLLIEDTRSFSLSADPPVSYARPSIDVLFESAAHAYEEGLVGVILTGASCDGAAGLAAVKRGGGLTVVQEPDTAESPTMPRAALRATPVDHRMNLEDIGVLLRTMGRE